jgi:hypothetical protein
MIIPTKNLKKLSWPSLFLVLSISLGTLVSKNVDAEDYRNTPTKFIKDISCDGAAHQMELDRAEWLNQLCAIRSIENNTDQDCMQNVVGRLENGLCKFSVLCTPCDEVIGTDFELEEEEEPAY